MEEDVSFRDANPKKAGAEKNGYIISQVNQWH